MGLCYGITKNPNEKSDYMLVFDYDVLNYNLSETFGEITWKCKIDELIDKLLDLLNEIINKEGYLKIVRITKFSNESLETLKIIENCTGCKDNLKKYNLDEFHKLINEIENRLQEEKEKEEKERQEKFDIIFGLLNINIKLF